MTETRKYLFAAIGRRPVFVLCKERVRPETLEAAKAFMLDKMRASD